eukprot:33777_1
MKAIMVAVVCLMTITNANELNCDKCSTNFNFPAVGHNGLCYATIGGAEPTDAVDRTACENTFHTLPQGWNVASAGSDTIFVASSYPWSTQAVGYNAGVIGGLDISWSPTSPDISNCEGAVLAFCDSLLYVDYDEASGQYKA